MQCSGSQKRYSFEKVSEVQHNQYLHVLKGGCWKQKDA